ncbi:MAG: hypothetical protein QNJ64_12470 [Crocosphaera sp.]|nr:hypothetical protein [Crocosphaera sp.]
MLRSVTFNNYLEKCDSIEQILDLCAQALHNSYASTAFLITGIQDDGTPIYSSKINHWGGSQLIADNRAEEQTITTFTTKVNLSHKQSETPWLEVQPLGDPADTPNGIFA